MESSSVRVAGKGLGHLCSAEGCTGATEGSCKAPNTRNTLAVNPTHLQPCQEPGGAPGKQAFYSVDLSLEFAESATAVLWTVENYFRCVGK